MRRIEYVCDGCATTVFDSVDSTAPAGWAKITILVKGFGGWKQSDLRDLAETRELCEGCQLGFNHDILAALSAKRGVNKETE